MLWSFGNGPDRQDEPVKSSMRHMLCTKVSFRPLLSLLLVFAVLVSPYSFAGGRHLGHHENHSSTGHDDTPPISDHSGLGHVLFHCGSAFCTPSFIDMPTVVTAHAAVWRQLDLTARDDSSLGSLYLDCDPPVPRHGFSVI